MIMSSKIRLGLILKGTRIKKKYEGKLVKFFSRMSSLQIN